MSVHNTQAYVQHAIESILNQTMTDLELIIVDDCSTDGSWSIITELAASDPRIVAMRNDRNLGLSLSLNRGLAVAQGAYITRQDSDDYSLPDRLEKQVSFLETENEVGMVGTQVILIDSEGQHLRVANYPTENATIQARLLDQMCFCGPTVMVKRDTFVAAGFHFDERFSGSDDYDLCLRLAEVSELANLETPHYGYRQHDSSMSRSKRYQLMYRKAGALEEAVKRRYGHAVTADKIALLARDYLRAAILAYANNEKGEAVDPLQRAMAFNPALLDMPAQVEDIVRRYTPHDSTERSLSFTRGVFSELLPTNRALSRVRRKLLAEIYAKEVFSVNADAARLRSNLWAGIRNKPRWLLNRGVLALIFRQLFRRSQSSVSPQDD
jgi:glycosyltransferase involved in cell wall biosynthesis